MRESLHTTHHKHALLLWTAHLSHLVPHNSTDRVPKQAYWWSVDRVQVLKLFSPEWLSHAHVARGLQQWTESGCSVLFPATLVGRTWAGPGSVPYGCPKQICGKRPNLSFVAAFDHIKDRVWCKTQSGSCKGSSCWTNMLIHNNNCFFSYPFLTLLYYPSSSATLLSPSSSFFSIPLLLSHPSYLYWPLVNAPPCTAITQSVKEIVGLKCDYVHVWIRD